MTETETETDLPEKASYYLDPGYIYFPADPTTLRTVVGVCVAVCLWDAQLEQGAMNHFIHPATANPETATPKFGNVATAELIAMMERAGSSRENLQAQILGGAAPKGPGGPETGVNNAQMARDVLRRKGIQIVSEDTGGNMGRKIVFDTGTGHVMVLKVQRIRSEDWGEADQAQ